MEKEEKHKTCTSKNKNFTNTNNNNSYNYNEKNKLTQINLRINAALSEAIFQTKMCGRNKVYTSVIFMWTEQLATPKEFSSPVVIPREINQSIDLFAFHKCLYLPTSL